MVKEGYDSSPQDHFRLLPVFLYIQTGASPPGGGGGEAGKYSYPPLLKSGGDVHTRPTTVHTSGHTADDSSLHSKIRGAAPAYKLARSQQWPMDIGHIWSISNLKETSHLRDFIIIDIIDS